MKNIKILLVVLMAAFANLVMAEPNFPEYGGDIVDQEGLLTADELKSIGDKIAAFESKSDTKIMVAIVTSLDGMDIGDYGVQLTEKWGFVEKTNNNGALMVVNKATGSVTMLFTNGLDGNLGNELAQLIINEDVVKKFEAGNYAWGIEAGVEKMILGVLGEISAQSMKDEKAAADTMWLYIMGGVLVVVFGVIMFIRSRWGGGGIEDEDAMIFDDDYDNDDRDKDDNADDTSDDDGDSGGDD